MLLRKMLRDMKANAVQFVSIFIMAILGVFVYAGINAEWYGMKTESDRFYRESHLADLWVMGENFKKEDVKKAEGLPGVSAASLRLTFDTTADVAGQPLLRINITDGGALSMPQTMEGTGFDASADGLWLDVSFARAHGLKAGDRISMDFMGEKIEKAIAGLVMHPEYIYNVKDDGAFLPDPKAFGFAFLPSSALPAGLELPYNQLLVSLGDGTDRKTARADLENLFSGRYGIILDRDSHPSVAMFKNEIEQNKAMGGVFPVVFFLIAALTMLTTMTRITVGQRTQIGVLKAMGFSRRRILAHYISYGVWIGLAGGLIGLFSGPLVIPPILFGMQKTMYCLPGWYAAISPTSLAAVGISVLCCGASSWFACRRQLKEVPAAALRPLAPKTGRHTGIEKSRLWLSFGFSAQWNLRDVMRSRIRSVMAAVGVMGCTALLLFGLGLRDTVGSVSAWMYRDLNVYESKISLNEDIDNKALDALEKAYGGQWVQESNIELRSGDTEENGLLTVLGEGGEIRFEDENRKGIGLPDEGVGLSYKMAGLLRLAKGDTVEWRIYGEKQWQKSEVSVLFRTPLGQGIAMGKEAYLKTGRTMRPTALLTSGNAAGADKYEGVKNVQDKIRLIDSYNDTLESMKMIIAILVIGAAVLGSVVLYNLGALSFTERIRELATLKVLGFFSKEIRSLLQMQNVWLTVLGIAAGVPAGYILVEFMLSTMPDTMDMMPYVSALSLSVSVAGTFILSFAVNLLLSRKVRGIDMVASLKSVE